MKDMDMRAVPVNPQNCFAKASGYVRALRMILATASAVSLLSLGLPRQLVLAAANPPAQSAETGTSAESLGVHFVPGSSSTIMIERDGKIYLVNLAEKTIQEKDAPVAASAGTS